MEQVVISMMQVNAVVVGYRPGRSAYLKWVKYKVETAGLLFICYQIRTIPGSYVLREIVFTQLKCISCDD